MSRTIELLQEPSVVRADYSVSARRIIDSLYRRENHIADASTLRKACRSLKPKRFRAIVRELVAAKVVKVKRAA